MKILRTLLVVFLAFSIVLVSGCSLPEAVTDVFAQKANNGEPQQATLEPAPTPTPSERPVPTPPPATPTPTPAPTPTPTPTPAPTPEPTPAPAPRAPGIKITKDPYDELSVTEGQEKVLFIARAENYEQMSWEFMDANGAIFSAEDAVKYHGQIIDGYNSETLTIWNASWTINEWQVRAIFYNFTLGERFYTNWARIRLVEPVYVPPAPPIEPDPPVIIDSGDVYIGEMQLYVIGNGVLIRDTPGGMWNGYREAGQIVTVNAENGNWYRLSDGSGYISKDYVSSDRWDIWNHFVEKYGTIMIVDLRDQHAYCYVNGVLMGETDCVTGDAYASPTPIGLYSVWSKRADFNMLDDPAYYTTYATFFNNGIAIHDADHWRSEYGGTIYQGGGSHGCVNTPAWFAELVYFNSTNGTPVLVIP